MTSDAHRLLGRLRDLGVALSAHAGGLVFEAPSGVMTAALRSEVARHKPALLAVLTGHPVPSHVPGWAWHPCGGFGPADPPDLPGLCVEAARARGFPRLPLPHRPAEAVAAGERAWRAFAGSASTIDLLHVLDVLGPPT